MLAALVLVPWGLWLGLAPAGTCGSAWFPDSQQEQVEQFTAAMSGLPDTFPEYCQEQWGNDGAIGGALTGFGGLCVLTGVVVWSQGRRPVMVAPVGSVAGGEDGDAGEGE